MQKLKKIKEQVKKNPKKTLLVIIFSILTILFFLPNPAKAPIENKNSLPTVEVKTVAEISNEDPFTLYGEVKNISQAELRTEKSGKVTQVYVHAGEYVRAGSILAEIDNATEKAGILSAKGALNAAEANLLKIKNGARTEDKIAANIQTQNSSITLQTAEQNAKNAYGTAYGTAQNSIFAIADTHFNNPHTVNPSFHINSANYDEKQELKKERVKIETILENWKKNTEANIQAENLNSLLIQAENDLDFIKTFLNKISYFISKQEINSNLSQTEKSTEETAIQAAIINVSNAKSSVSASRSAVTNAYTAKTVNSLNESKIITGARSEDVLVAEAQVTQAKGALASAYSIFEKSIIRTPISGTLSTFNISKGEYVPIQKSVAVIVGDNRNEIETFVSENTLKRIHADMPVIINDAYKGKITSVSPGLDPVTKKARVTISLLENTNLTNGSYAKIKILNDEENKKEEYKDEGFLIPITAIKVLPNGLAVFTVSKDGTLKAHEIKEGPIVGSKMLVKKGLAPELQIVTDVRGYSENDEVSIK